VGAFARHPHVSIRSTPPTWRAGAAPVPGAHAVRRFDQAEEVALVARAKRELLLRVHRHRLRREDLEDCFSQATLELVAHARRGGRFASSQHVANALEQRFVSRVHDRRRALSGRSPMQAALEAALSLGYSEREQADVIDARAELETLVLLRDDVRRLSALASELTRDQRLVLASQLAQIDCRTFCRRHNWSAEKYRKVAQRARARLRALVERDECAVPSGGHPSDQRIGTPYEHKAPHS